MADPQTVLEMIKEHDVKYVDFRFTDPRGSAAPWRIMSARSPKTSERGRAV